MLKIPILSDLPARLIAFGTPWRAYNKLVRTHHYKDSIDDLSFSLFDRDFHPLNPLPH